VTGVVAVEFVSAFLATDVNFGGVDDDDVITTIEVGAVVGLVFAGKEFGNGSRNTSEGLALKVYDVPLAFDVRQLGTGGFGHMGYFALT
jgi:hypothetical protein